MVGDGRGSVPSYEFDELGVLQIRFEAGARFGREAAREAVRIHLEVAAGRRHLTLVDVSNVTSVDREARNLVSGPAIASVTAALAIVVGGPISSVIGNFFIRVQRPDYRTRLFTNRDKAMEWLRSQSISESHAEPAKEAE